MIEVIFERRQRWRC